MVDLAYLKRNIFPAESGGDYNALFGYANRQGPFQGTRLTDMTLNEALQFSDPSGPYASTVRGQIDRTATPMGAYQVVGTTLRDAVKGLGLTGNERFDEGMQDRIAQWIYQTQGPQAWEGWGGGNVTKSTKGGAGMVGLLDMQDEEPQGFGQRLKSDWRSGDLLDRLALGFNSMRMNPDQGIAQIVGNRMQQRQEQRAQDKATNRTAAWLASIGREDLAGAMLSGGLDPKSAAQLAMTPPEAKGSVVDAAALRERFPNAQIADGLYSVQPDGTITRVGGDVAQATGTDDMREYDAAVKQGFTGTFMDYLTTVKKASAPTTTLPAGETAYDKSMGEWGAKTYTSVQDNAAAAMDQLGNLSYMESLMNSPSFRSGTGTEALVSMQKLVEALGGNPADVASIEAFRGATAQAVLGQMGGSLGAGFSNADRSFVESMAANLDNSVQGNKLIIGAQRKVAQRKIELARLADQYIAEKGRLDAGWPQYMRAYAEQNPLFGSPPPAVTGGGGGTDPTTYIPMGQ